MKPTTPVRFMCSIALFLSLLIWTAEFIWVDGHSISLYELIENFNNTVFGYSFPLSAVLALICGSLLFLVGLFGVVRPESNALLVVSISASVVVIISAAAIYAIISSIMEQAQLTRIGFGEGSYIIGAILLIEIVISISARRWTTAQSLS